jgi:hypothetical protein
MYGHIGFSGVGNGMYNMMCYYFHFHFHFHFISESCFLREHNKKLFEHKCLCIREEMTINPRENVLHLIVWVSYKAMA